MRLSKLVFSISLLVNGSFAFKMGTHIASANKASNQISAFIDPTKLTPDNLEFLVEGKVFKVAVSKKDAFDAIMTTGNFPSILDWNQPSMLSKERG